MDLELPLTVNTLVVVPGSLVMVPMASVVQAELHLCLADNPEVANVLEEMEDLVEVGKVATVEGVEVVATPAVEAHITAQLMEGVVVLTILEYCNKTPLET